MNKQCFRVSPSVLLTLLAFSFLLISSLSLFANMGDPHRRGEPVGEPSPLLDSIHVLHEQLRIDMRTLALGRGNGTAHVEAVYRLRNDGAAKTLDLVFIAAGLRDSAGTFRVTLDGQPVFGQYNSWLSVPAEWRLPELTPGLGEKKAFPYAVELRRFGRVFDPMSNGRLLGADSVPTILFTLRLPPGEHRVAVAYEAEPTGYPHGGDVYVWQLGYILAPARHWGSFGRLEAQILVPEGWEAATSPEMERRGDTLIGTWNGIPADAIALSMRKHISAIEYGIAQYLPIVLSILLFGLLTFRMGWKKGLRLAEEGRGLKGAIGISILGSILSYMMFGAGLVAGSVWANNVLGNQAIPSYSFMGLFLLLFFCLPLVLVPSPIALVAAGMAKSRALRARPPQETPPEPISGI